MLLSEGTVPSNKIAKDGDYDEHYLKAAADTIAKSAEYQADPNLMKQLRPYLERKEKAYYSLKELRELGGKKRLAEIRDNDEHKHYQEMSAQEGEMGYKNK